MNRIVLVDQRLLYCMRYGWCLRKTANVATAGNDQMASTCSKDLLEQSEARRRKRADAKLAVSTWVHDPTFLYYYISPRKTDARHLSQLIEEGL